MESPRDPLRKIPTKHAPEIKADIGSALRAARAKRSQSLDAATQHTRIPKKFLDALENNRFEEFPALAYLRGFLKSYCDYLEIDFDPLWRQVEAPAQQEPAAQAPEAPQPAPEPAAAKAPAPKGPAPKPHAPAAAASKPPKPVAAPAPASAPKAAKANGHPPSHAAEADAPLWLPGILVLAGVLVAGVGGYFLTARRPAAPHAQQPAPTTPAALEPVRPAVEAQVSLQFRREMWVSVSVDGVEKFQGRVPQGSKQDWKPRKAVTLRASDPQGLKVTINGENHALGNPEADGTFRLEAQ